jgi:acyl-coenzyme A thioesterase PaaI-like protein
MSLDFSTIAIGMPQAVPMVATLGIVFQEVGPRRTVLLLPDQAPYRNHIGGPHAGAMFTLAETATGALVLGHFGDILDQATPLIVEATVRFLKIARGDVTAVATMEADPDELRRQLDAGERPEWNVNVSLTTEQPDGSLLLTGEMTTLWTLKPVRKPEAPGAETPSV